MTIGSFGATLKTGTLPGFATVHRIAGNRIARLAKLEGAELNDAKKVWQPKPPPCAMAVMRRKKPKLQRAKLSKAAAKVLICQVCRLERVNSIPASDF